MCFGTVAHSSALFSQQNTRAHKMFQQRKEALWVSEVEFIVEECTRLFQGFLHELTTGSKNGATHRLEIADCVFVFRSHWSGLKENANKSDTYISISQNWKMTVWLQQHCVPSVVNSFFSASCPSAWVSGCSFIAQIAEDIPVQSHWKKTSMEGVLFFLLGEKRCRERICICLQASSDSFWFDTADCLFPLHCKGIALGNRKSYICLKMNWCKKKQKTTQAGVASAVVIRNSGQYRLVFLKNILQPKDQLSYFQF